MKLQSIEEVNDFLKAVNSCHGRVWLSSIYGDRFELKSELSQYVAIGALLSQKQEYLELFCDEKDDERILMEFFANHENVI